LYYCYGMFRSVNRLRFARGVTFHSLAEKVCFAVIGYIVNGYCLNFIVNRPKHTIAVVQEIRLIDWLVFNAYFKLECKRIMKILELPPKATPLIRLDCRWTRIVKCYLIFPITSSHPSCKDTFPLLYGWPYKRGITVFVLNHH
jgi:hypothetical protein